MNLFKKSIFTAASPNSQRDDAWLAFKTLFAPWVWNNQEINRNFKTNLKMYTGAKHVALVDSGRTALLTILKSLLIRQDEEVIMPSFTCIVVANAVKWSGAKPIYLDTSKEDFNANYSKLTEKVTAKTRAVLVQHTFGKKVDVYRIKSDLKRINREDVLVIEDYAHDIHKDLDFKGDFAFTTFGIEKVISTVRGGAILTNNDELFKSVEKVISTYKNFPTKRIVISLLNPIFWWFAIPLHSVGYKRFTIGALIRSIWRKLGFLGIMVEDSENHAKKPDWFPVRMSPALSRLGIKQLKKLDFYNSHRIEIAQIYHSKLSSISDSKEFKSNRVYLRYPILLKNGKQALEVWNKARELKVTLGNWFSSPLYGSGVNQNTYDELCYVPETTPVTLDKCTRVLNLPTSINMNKERAKELAKGIAEIVGRK